MMRIRYVLLSFLVFVCGCKQSNSEVYGEFESNLKQKLKDQPDIPLVRLTEGRIGLGLIPRNYNDSVDSWVESLQIAQHLGIQVLQIPSGYWKEDEPVKGAFQWESMHRLIEALGVVGIDFEVSQDFGGPFFHADNMAPEYLQPIDLTDPRFDEAYLIYLSAYLEQFGNHVSRILIHAEGSYSYFDEHPDHIDHYTNLLSKASRLIKEKWPNVQLGVNIDPNNDAKILSAISEPLDFIGFDIVQIEDVLEKPEDLVHVIEKILANTAGKPVSLACGWSSAPGLGGGDQAQVDFYEEVFGILKKYRERIEYVVVGPPFDENEDFLRPAYEAQFTHLPNEFVSKIINWITNLGLIRVDGTSKPAYDELRALIQDYYQQQ